MSLLAWYRCGKKPPKVVNLESSRRGDAGGRLAQLGERGVRIAEVGGSSPLPSTIFLPEPKRRDAVIEKEILILTGTAATLGFVHTLVGPDHYLPFIVISRARRWSLGKTLLISFFCGLGHVLSSVVLGLVGIALGIAVARLEGVETARGSLAAWLLIGFGFAYFVWGLWRALKHKSHSHVHTHPEGEEHEHAHIHQSDHYHLHGARAKSSLTPWILFTIFVFGPCEPLIPLVMYPAAKHNILGVVLVTAAFGLITIGTMLALIALSSWGLSFLRLGKLETYVHALAGAMIFLSGLGVQFLGL